MPISFWNRVSAEEMIVMTVMIVECVPVGIV